MLRDSLLHGAKQVVRLVELSGNEDQGDGVDHVLTCLLENDHEYGNYDSGAGGGEVGTTSAKYSTHNDYDKEVSGAGADSGAAINSSGKAGTACADTGGTTGTTDDPSANSGPTISATVTGGTTGTIGGSLAHGGVTNSSDRAGRACADV